jgi:protein-tyrosine phosphatase
MGHREDRTVLFLCTGNYYRSRFAEILFNSVAAKMGLPWRASSRGLAMERGVNNVGSMAASAITTLKAMGVAAGAECARLPTEATHDDFATATRIVALKLAEHQPLLQERFPTWADKVEFWHVDDAPDALGLIEQEVMPLVARIVGGGEQQESNAAQSQPAPADEQPSKKPLTAMVGRETSGRRGKGVTTVFDLPLNEEELQRLASTLKQRCGTGGTAKDGRIEIQGDQRQRIIAELQKLGYKVTGTTSSRIPSAAGQNSWRRGSEAGPAC